MAEDFSIESTMGGSAVFTIAAGRGGKGISNKEHRIVKWGGPVFAGSKRNENVLGP